jgi:hypothetical protein
MPNNVDGTTPDNSESGKKPLLTLAAIDVSYRTLSFIKSEA